MNNTRQAIFFLLFLTVFFLFILQPVFCADEVESSTAKIDYGILAGKWQRTDGNYLIKVSDVQAGGQGRRLDLDVHRSALDPGPADPR